MCQSKTSKLNEIRKTEKFQVLFPHKAKTDIACLRNDVWLLFSGLQVIVYRFYSGFQKLLQYYGCLVQQYDTCGWTDDIDSPPSSWSRLGFLFLLVDLDPDGVLVTVGVGAGVTPFSSSSSSLECSGVLSSPFSSCSLALVQIDCRRILSSYIYNYKNL